MTVRTWRSARCMAAVATIVAVTACTQSGGHGADGHVPAATTPVPGSDGTTAQRSLADSPDTARGRTIAGTVSLTGSRRQWVAADRYAVGVPCGLAAVFTPGDSEGTPPFTETSQIVVSDETGATVASTLLVDAQVGTVTAARARVGAFYCSFAFSVVAPAAQTYRLTFPGAATQTYPGNGLPTSVSLLIGDGTGWIPPGAGRGDAAAAAPVAACGKAIDALHRFVDNDYTSQTVTAALTPLHALDLVLETSGTAGQVQAAGRRLDSDLGVVKSYVADGKAVPTGTTVKILVDTGTLARSCRAIGYTG